MRTASPQRRPPRPTPTTQPAHAGRSRADDDHDDEAPGWPCSKPPSVSLSPHRRTYIAPDYSYDCAKPRFARHKQTPRRSEADCRSVRQGHADGTTAPGVTRPQVATPLLGRGYAAEASKWGPPATRFGELGAPPSSRTHDRIRVPLVAELAIALRQTSRAALVAQMPESGPGARRRLPSWHCDHARSAGCVSARRQKESR